MSLLAKATYQLNNTLLLLLLRSIRYPLQDPVTSLNHNYPTKPQSISIFTVIRN